jgi:hypothetical protein
VIPLLVTVQRRDDGRWWRLYVPVVPLAVVLLPLLLLVVLAGVVACVVYRVNVVGALRGTGRVLWALPGSRFDIEYGCSAVQVHIS